MPRKRRQCVYTHAHTLESQAIDPPSPSAIYKRVALPVAAGHLHCTPVRDARGDRSSYVMAPSSRRACHGWAWALTMVVVLALSASSADDAACDLFRGRWVADKSYPLYDASACPFVPDVFDCRRNGRPDDAYLKFRWSPANNCQLPRSVELGHGHAGRLLGAVVVHVTVRSARSLLNSPRAALYVCLGLTAPTS